ncbi:MAG: porin family protein [Paludibacter sp.]
MKTKFILASLLFLSLSIVGNAQDNTTVEKPKAKIWIGPKFGLDITNFTTDVNSVANQLGSNYQAGLMLQLGETLYLQPEAYYCFKKFSSTVDSSYIKVPVMVGLKFLDIGLLSLHLNGGPQFRFPLDKSDKPTGKMSLDWQVGAGLDVLGFITADLRYTLIQGQSIADQVKTIGTAPLNLTVGLKFR